MGEADPESVLDLRGLQPPEPLERTLEALDTLAPGAQLHILVPHEPFPLYAILDRHGYRWKSEALPDGGFSVLIWHA